MIAFAYQARDSKGKIVTGVSESTDEDTAIQTLMGRGLMVVSIKEGPLRLRGKRQSVPAETDLVLFTRQLATMVEAGLPLLSALGALYEQCDPRKQAALKFLIEEIMTRIQRGETFTEAVSRHPKAFPRLYSSMIKAGEQGGMLAEVLERLAGFMEANARLRKKVKSAMTYPVIVIAIALTITTGLIVKVVPVFADIFASMGASLPAPTQFLINLSTALREQWYWFIMVGAGIFFGIKTFLATRRGIEWWDFYKLRLPVVGPLTRKICLSRFSRTFAQLIRSGMPIMEVMSIVGETSGNTVVEKAIKSVALDVEKGDQLGGAMSRQAIFPAMMLRMVSAGEATGNMDTMLEKMAEFWDEEIEAMLSAMTSLIEPLLIVFLGVVVGGIVISMYLPIFKLNDVIAGAK